MTLGMVPVGTIMAYGCYVEETMQDLQDAGWLYCDGGSFTQSQWPELAKLMSNAWGGDGTGMFYKPDLRGYFLRGVDGDAGGVDPDADSRLHSVANTSEGNDGNRVGSLQEDLVGPHTNSTMVQYSAKDGSADAHGGYSMNDILGGRAYDDSPGQTTHSLPADGSPAETRAKNKYVYFIIYAGASGASS
jgi:hypothetical protein